MDFKDWLSIAGLALNALIVPVLWKGAAWIFQVEKRLTIVETQQMSAIDQLVHRTRFGETRFSPGGNEKP